MTTLDEQVEAELARLDIPSEFRTYVTNCLGSLKNHDLATYEHSVRVGLRGAAAAEFLNLDKKYLTLAGFLHDVGKLKIPKALLQKTKGFTNDDLEQIKPHVLQSYEKLKTQDKFIADVVLRHHRYQEESYPSGWDLIPHTDLDPSYLKKVNDYAKVLSLLDCHDAMHRTNDKFGKEPLSAEEIKNTLFQLKPEMSETIHKLYTLGIFGREKVQPQDCDCPVPCQSCRGKDPLEPTSESLKLNP